MANDRLIQVFESTGDVGGPSNAVDNRIVLFDGITGKLIKDSGYTIPDIQSKWDNVTGGINYASGNIGIGTVTPLSKLHINGGIGSLATGLAFGDGDTGIYESVDDILVIERAGITNFYFTGGGFWGSNSTKVLLRGNINATSTVPVIIPDGSDQNTGIGSAAADQLSLIAGGIEGLRVTTTDIKTDVINELTTDYGITIGQTLETDQTNNRVGINLPTINTPIVTLDIGGNLNFDSILKPDITAVNAIVLTENASAGTLPAGLYYYNIHYLDIYGNSVGSTPEGATLIPSITVALNSAVTLTNIPTSTDSRVTGRRITRTSADVSKHLGYKIYDISNNVDTSFQDTGYSQDTSKADYRNANTTAGKITIDGSNAILIQDFNTIIGTGAGSSITSGNSIVLIGRLAGSGITSGSNNNFIGYVSGSSITTGSGNNAIGYASLYSINTNASHNTAIGDNAARGGAASTITTGNTAIGYGALFSSQNTITYNVAIGYQAGYNIGEAGSMSNNIFIGYQAGYGGTFDYGNKNIFIGYQVSAPNANQNDYLNIGNAILGDLSSGDISITGDLQVDIINEYTASAGVTIDSVLIKDGRATNSTSAAPTTDAELANKKYVDDNDFSSPLTTKGDIHTYSTVDDRLPVGTDGQILNADSIQSSGIKWLNYNHTNIANKLVPIGNNNTSLWLVSPKATYYNGNTYIVYLDFADNGRKIAKYNHATDTWTSATWTQTAIDTGSNITNGDYAHGSPSIFVDSSGYIHISYGSYKNVAMYTIRSSNPENIIAFESEVTVESAITGSGASYPTMLEISSTLVLFYRGADVNSMVLSRATSADNGNTWSNIIDITTDKPYYQVRKDKNDRVHIAWHANPSTNDNLYYIYTDNANAASPTFKTVDGVTESTPIGLTTGKVFDSTSWDNCYLLGLAVDDNQKVHIFTYVSDSVNTDKLLYFEYSSSTWNQTTLIEENLSTWTVGSIQGDVIYKDDTISLMVEYISDTSFGTYGKAEIYEWNSYTNGTNWIFNKYVTAHSNDTTANPFYVRESGYRCWYEGDNSYAVGKSMYIGMPMYGDMFSFIYDPSGIKADVFNMTNMVEGSIKKILTNTTQSISGVKTFNSFPITPSSAPTTDYQTANKKYVDDTSGGSSQWANVTGGINYPDGNVGIGDTTPTYKLDVNGTGRFISTVTATNFILSSDKRLKENIKPIQTSNIDNIGIKQFNMIGNDRLRYGVIAQELEEVHPEMVYENEEGMKQVAYIDFMLVKITQLENRIKQLEK